MTAADGDGIVATDSLFAERLKKVAVAWAVCPGLHVFVEQPLPDKGLGYDVGHTLLKLGAGKVTIAELAKEWRSVREVLGPYRGWSPTLPRADTEAGAFGFYRQLDRFFDGTTWSPPITAKPAIKPLGGTSDVQLSPKASSGHADTVSATEADPSRPATTGSAGPIELNPTTNSAPPAVPTTNAAGVQAAGSTAPDEAFIDCVRRVLAQRALPLNRDMVLTKAGLPVGGKSYGMLTWMAKHGLIRSSAIGYSAAR